MDIVRPDIQKKRLALVVVDEGCRFPDDGVGDVFIHPEGFLAACHPADTPDAIDDGHIMAMGVLLFEELRVFASGWPVSDPLFVVNLNRVSGVETDDIPVFDPHGRDAVDGCRNQVGLIKSECVCTGSDMFVPIQRGCCISKAKVPFADGARRVPSILEAPRERWTCWIDNH